VDEEGDYFVAKVLDLYGEGRVGYKEWKTREFRQAMMAHATGPFARQYVAMKRKLDDGKNQRNRTNFLISELKKPGVGTSRFTQ